MNNKINDYLQYLKNHLKKNFLDLNKNQIVFGLSCGIDSVLCLKILSLFLEPKQIKPFFIDIESSKDKQYLKIVQNYFSNIEIEYIDLKLEYEILKTKFNSSFESSMNLKSRLRSLFLYDYAFKNNSLVLSTINFDEYYLGYFTKFGDANGDIFLINGLLKKDVYEFAKFLNIPNEIINRKPTHGLNDEEYDEDCLMFDYNDLDNYIIDKNNINDKIKKRIIDLREKNKHKLISLEPFLLKRF